MGSDVGLILTLCNNELIPEMGVFSRVADLRENCKS